MKIVKVRWEKFAVRCNTGYLANGREVGTLEEATKFATQQRAEEAIGRQRKRGWNMLWIETLPQPWKKVVVAR